MKKVVLILFLLWVVNISPAIAEVVDPQYIFVRKAPDICNPKDCSQLWNMGTGNRDFGPGVDDIVSKVGTLGTNQRKLGIGVLFYYNRATYDFNIMQRSLRNLLQTAEIKNIPLFIALDGFQWQDGRPDLWNWYDPSKPGYNPDNKNNVEWTCGNSSCAVNKAWRNWGFEFETSPHPNLASRTFIEDSKRHLNMLIPIIIDWYQNLPTDKKWLLGGISLGVETDMGGNFYYYKNGTVTGRGQIDTAQQGYAAITTLGLSGGMTSTNLNEVIKRYNNELDKYAYDLGIPRNKIFNHIGGYDLHPFPVPASTGLVFPTTAGAPTEYGYPGWSFYGNVTTSPQNFTGLSSVLNQVNNVQWASLEWHTFATDQNGYTNALSGSLSFRNNRFVNISNWEEIRDKPYALNALKTVLSQSPTCWVETPVVEVKVNSNMATLTWQKGNHNEVLYLNVSTVADLTTGGTLKTVNVANENVTGISSKILNNLGEGKYYWTLITDGCSNQRKIADGRFEIVNLSGDFNKDNVVNLADFAFWKSKYLDGQMTLVEFGEWKRGYLK